MGNENSPFNNKSIQESDFDKTHPHFGKLLSKYQIGKDIDRYQFKKLFFPLTSDLIPFDDLFNIFDTNKQGKIPKSKIKELYSLFFGQNKKNKSQYIKSLIFSEKPANQPDGYNNKIDKLFSHEIDCEIKTLLTQYTPESKINNDIISYNGIKVKG